MKFFICMILFGSMVACVTATIKPEGVQFSHEKESRQ